MVWHVFYYPHLFFKKKFHTIRPIIYAPFTGAVFINNCTYPNINNTWRLQRSIAKTCTIYHYNSTSNTTIKRIRIRLSSWSRPLNNIFFFIFVLKSYVIASNWLLASSRIVDWFADDVTYLGSTLKVTIHYATFRASFAALIFFSHSTGAKTGLNLHQNNSLRGNKGLLIRYCTKLILS